MLLLLPLGMHAQIFVDADNEVGIGTTTPSSKLHVYVGGTLNGTGLTLYNEHTGSSSKIGILNHVTLDGSGPRYGLYNNIWSPNNLVQSATGVYNDLPSTVNTATGVHNDLHQSASSSGFARGVFNEIMAEGVYSAFGEYTQVSSGAASSGARFGNYISVTTTGLGTKYGIASFVGGSANYAGLFSGNVLVTGVFTNPSDAKTKQNIREIDGALGLVTRLQPRSYEYRQNLGLGLPEGQQFGFVAQDLEQVLPQLVSEAKVPVQATEEAADRQSPDGPAEPGFTTLKSVNYIGLIPVLAQAIQELSAKVDAQAAEIARLQLEAKDR